MSYCISDIVILRKEQNKTFKHPFFQEVLDGANLLPCQALPFLRRKNTKQRKAVNDLALSVKQEKFCLEYAKSGNQRQAYLKAGYKVKNDETADANASRLLRNANVKARLAELAEEIKAASIADITEMQQTLTSIIRQQLEEEVIVIESVGDFMSEARKMDKKPAIKDIISAINTLGKMQGLFVDKVEADIDMDLNITVDYGEGDDG